MPQRRPRSRPDRALADKAYSSRSNRAYLAGREIKATIPVPADQAIHRKRRGTADGRPPALDPTIDHDRHAVESGINTLKHTPGITTRHDKTAVRHTATINIANIDR